MKVENIEENNQKINIKPVVSLQPPIFNKIELSSGVTLKEGIKHKWWRKGKSGNDHWNHRTRWQLFGRISD
jgi:hypothetical protein